MSTKSRALSTETTSDFPFDRHLRIPPLLDPLPLLSSRRPSPLEPNARVNDASHNSTARLSSRAKVLDEAKATGNDAAAPAYSTRARAAGTGNGHVAAKPEAIDEGSRKRQKADYFQLPRPTSKSRTNKPPPFKPVAVLNELHEPPPSAALFPPITPNARHDSGIPAGLESKLSAPDHRRDRRLEAPQKIPARIPPFAPAKDDKGRAKRVCLRGRLKWTEGETEDLMKGVGMFGVGKWKKILNHPDLKFHPDRTMVDLKDRYRTCRMNEEKAIERQAAEDYLKASKPDDDLSSPESGVSPDPKLQTSSEKRRVLRSAEDDVQSAEKTPSSPLSPASSDFNIFTPNNFNNFNKRALCRVKKQGTGHPWTADEDADLSKGYQKYGFQWTTIAKDKELCLSHRTGAQVRDRFRMKYPIVYQSSVPLPLPDATKRPSRARPDRKSPIVLSARAKPSSNTPTQLMFIINGSVNPPNSITSKASVVSTARNVSYAQRSLSEAQAPSTPAIVDRFAGLDVQPLPDPVGDGDGQSDSASSADLSATQRSRQSSAEAEEARHLSILGLLNEESGQGSRLPPFKYSFDHWSTGSVTLPPLHWEEVCPEFPLK